MEDEKVYENAGEIERLRELVEIFKRYTFYVECSKEGCTAVQISDGLLVPTCLDCKFIQKCGKCERPFCNFHLVEKGLFIKSVYCDACIKNNGVSYF